jgi:uncharacterized protein with NRDE domain
MCLLAVYYRVAEDAAVVVGANREEAYARVGEPPRLLEGPLSSAAGVDPVAGGTWLGVNERGVLVAVTNRAKSQVPDRPRSRGLLVRDLLGYSTAAKAAALATSALSQSLYAGCNLLCVDAHTAVVLHAGDWLRVRHLPPGLHVLTARDTNDAGDPRIAHALSWLAQRPHARAADCVAALRELCGQSGLDSPPICLHGEKGGTVSSSILALPSRLKQGVYLHAQGPPDQVPYADYSYLLRQLGGG